MRKKLLNFKQGLFIFSTIFGLISTQAQTQLTSSNFIGNTTTYGNNGTQDLSVAWDGDYTSSIDTAENWGFVGYDFGEGNGKQIATWKYAPRSGFADRLIDAELRGSNSSDYLNDFDVLYTVPSAPVEGSLTEVAINSTTTYRYVYVFLVSYSYSNISEFEVYDAGANELTGTVVGNPVGSEWCDTCTPDKSFDKDLNTYTEGPFAIGWVGYDFGSGNGATISSFKFAPRTGYANRMMNSELRASNADDYLTNYTVLYTITATPTEDVMTEVSISDTNQYRYVYWIGLDPDTGNPWMDSYGNISEFQLFGTQATLATTDYKLKNAYKLYPNPSRSGNFTLDIEPSHFGSTVNVQVYNVLGQKLSDNNYDSSLKTIEVNQNLKSGLYLVKIDNKDVSRLIVR